MNNKAISIIAILLIVGVGFVLLSSTSQPQTDESDRNMMKEEQPMEEMDGMEEDSMDAMDGMEDGAMEGMDEVEKKHGMTMEEHVEAIDDGQTIMIMGGQMYPETLYVSPGQTITVLNHENVDLSLESADGTIETDIIPPDGGGELTAPEEVGSYPYYSSSDEGIEGMLVVEK